MSLVAAFSPIAPTIGVPLWGSPSPLPSLAVPATHPCLEAARLLLASQPLGASLVRATAAMWGTNVGHFRPSAPPPSLLAASKYMTRIIAMSINVHIFIVNLHPLPPAPPHQNSSNVGNVEVRQCRRCRSSVSGRRSSVVGRRSSTGLIVQKRKLFYPTSPDC